MSRSKNKIRGLLCCGLLLVANLSSTVHASAGSSLTVSPAELNFKLQHAGDRQTLPISITNTYADSVRLSAQFAGINESAGLLTPTSTPLDANLSAVLHLSETDFTVPAHDTRTITVQFSDSSSLAPGGHYATLLLAQEGTGQGALKSVISLTIFAVKVTGAHPALVLTRLKTNGWLFALPSSANLRFSNSGNIHLVPRAAVRLIHGTSIVASGIANEISTPLLPGKTLDTTAPLSYSGHIWWPQHLQLEAIYRADGSDTTKTITRSVWYIPPIYPVLLILLLIIVVNHGRQEVNRLTAPKIKKTLALWLRAETFWARLKPPMAEQPPTVADTFEQQTPSSKDVDSDVTSISDDVPTEAALPAPSKPRKKKPSAKVRTKLVAPEHSPEPLKEPESLITLESLQRRTTKVIARPKASSAASSPKTKKAAKTAKRSKMSQTKRQEPQKS